MIQSPSLCVFKANLQEENCKPFIKCHKSNKKIKISCHLLSKQTLLEKTNAFITLMNNASLERFCD